MVGKVASRYPFGSSEKVKTNNYSATVEMAVTFFLEAEEETKVPGEVACRAVILLKLEDDIPLHSPKCTPPMKVITLLREAAVLLTRLTCRQDVKGRRRPESCVLQPVATVTNL